MSENIPEALDKALSIYERFGKKAMFLREAEMVYMTEEGDFSNSVVTDLTRRGIYQHMVPGGVMLSRLPALELKAMMNDWIISCSASC